MTSKPFHDWCSTPFVKKTWEGDMYVYTCVKCDCKVMARKGTRLDHPNFPPGADDCEERVVRKVMEA